MRSPVERIKDALFAQLGCSAYDCTRVWEAWSVGTMSEDDFVPVSERIEEIADALDRDLKYSDMQASHEELVTALETARPYVPNRTIGDRLLHRSFDEALANEAKLAPTRTGGSGCER